MAPIRPFLVVRSRRWLSVPLGLVAAASALLGCTTTLTEPGPESSSEVGSTTVDDGVGFETDEADQSPLDQAPLDPAVVDFVLVTVVLPDDQVLSGTAVISLQDVTLADAAPIELERVELPMNDLITQRGQVEVFLPVPLDGSVDVSAAVHVDADQDGLVSSGDWISDSIVLVTPDTVRGTFVSLIAV